MRDLLRRNRAVLGAAVLCYLIGGVIGLSVPVPADSLVAPAMGAQDFAANNLWVALLLVAGFVTVGIETILLLLGNGLMLGMALGAHIGVTPGPQIAAALVPHGIFEVPGLIIAGSVGMKSAQWCLGAVVRRPVPYLARDCLVGIVSAGLFIAIAAPIEAYVTPLMMGVR
jgi:stage II sporulation protein M